MFDIATPNLPGPIFIFQSLSQNLTFQNFDPDILYGLERSARNQEALLSGFLQSAFLDPQRLIAAEGAIHAAELASGAYRAEHSASEDALRQRLCEVEIEAMKAVQEARMGEMANLQTLR